MPDIFDLVYKRGFPGMIATTEYNNNVTAMAGADIPFGIIVGMSKAMTDASSPKDEMVVVPGAGDIPLGVALYDAVRANFPTTASSDIFSTYGGYRAKQPVSVMKEGVVYAKAKDNAVFVLGQPVKYGADGVVDPAGANTMVGAYIDGLAQKSPGGQTFVQIKLGKVAA